jgi:S-methylmethionine-dependent homocysteine/selenocysteine methylase
MTCIELLDGAMGSEFIKRGFKLPKHTWSANMNIDNPDTVYEIHKEYIEAGSNYITTNTFRSTPRSYIKTGLDKDAATKAAKKSLTGAINSAKKASNGKTKVLGSVAPLEDCYKPNLFPGKDIANKEFNQLATWFNVEEVDIILIEAMNSIIEAEACIRAFSKLNKPIWISFILLDNHHILSGETIPSVIKMVKKYNINAFLVNCSPLYITHKALKVISSNWDKRWGVYPNLGVGAPEPNGDIKIIHSNDNYIKLFYTATALGAELLGACCGSDPSHIEALNRFK